MEPEGSLPCLKDPVRGPYPEPNLVHIIAPTSLRSVLILPFHLPVLRNINTQ
jgi:hypothetical protein